MTPIEILPVIVQALAPLGDRARERAASICTDVLDLTGPERIKRIVDALAVLNRLDYRFSEGLAGRPKSPPEGWPEISTPEIADLTARVVRAIDAAQTKAAFVARRAKDEGDGDTLTGRFMRLGT